MNALHHLFTGLLYLVILLHPRGTVYCFRPRSPSIGTKKKAPPQSSSSSSSPPSSPPPPASTISSSTDSAIKAPFSTMEKKTPLLSKHSKHHLHDPVSFPTRPSHHHTPHPYQTPSAHLSAENTCNHCRITPCAQTHEVCRERTCYQLLELDESEFAAGVVQKMFQRGWTQVGVAPPAVHKILKINHSSEALINGFEKYRRRVQGRGSSSSAAAGNDDIDGRLSFDGNEIVGYWCSHLPDAPAQLPTMAEPMTKEILISRSSWRAHEKMHEDGVEGDSRARAMFVCRAIAGRVANNEQRRGGGIDNIVEEIEGGEFDSLAVGQDLLVLDARAILPCFIVVFEDDDIDEDEDEDGNVRSSPDWSSRSGQLTCSLSWYMRPITKS